MLEVRGETGDYYRVWDPARQRQGYVQKWQVRVFDPKRADTPDVLRVMVGMFRDAPGFENQDIARPQSE